jgi:ABC-2 type transport system permease protein
MSLLSVINMTGEKLIIQRFMKESKYQWGIIRTVLDWTILLYLAIPAVVIAPFLYVDVWENIHQYWSPSLPIALLLAPVLFLAASGNLRTYLTEADLLFLLQRKKILHRLKLYGFLSSLLRLILGVGAIIILILPILFKIYQFQPTDVLWLYIAVSAYRLLFLTLKKVINRPLYKWLCFPTAYIVSIVLILNIAPILYGIGSIVLILILFTFHITQIAKTNRWFLKEIEIEDTERARYIKLILNFSMEVEKEEFKQKTRPLFFWRKSGRLFTERSQENGLLEILLKAFLRNRGYLVTYFQIIMVTISAIIMLPLGLKWLVFMAFYIFLNFWLKSLFNKMLSSHFFTVVPYNKELSTTIWIRFKKRMSLPITIFIAVLLILLTL